MPLTALSTLGEVAVAVVAVAILVGFVAGDVFLVRALGRRLGNKEKRDR